MSGYLDDLKPKPPQAEFKLSVVGERQINIGAGGCDVVLRLDDDDILTVRVLAYDEERAPIVISEPCWPTEAIRFQETP